MMNKEPFRRYSSYTMAGLLDDSDHWVLCFIKPHALNCVTFVEEVFPSFLRRYDVEVAHECLHVFSEKKVFDNYVPESWFSGIPVVEALNHLPSTVVDRLIETVIPGGNIYDLSTRLFSARQALDKFSISAEDLNDAWFESNVGMTVIRGFYVKYVQLNTSKGAWVVNAYMPYRLEKFKQSGDKAKIFLLRLPSSMTIKQARLRMIGEISNSNTLRGHLWAHKTEYALEVDQFNNGVHCSDGIGASLREIALWLPGQFFNHPLVIALGKFEGIPIKWISSTVLRPEISFSMEGRDAKGLFRYLTDTWRRQK